MAATASPPSAAGRRRAAGARGHWWTVLGLLWRGLQRPPAPLSEPWETTVDDPRIGPVRLTGELSRPDGSGREGSGRPLLVLVHGLAGSSDSSYMRRAASHAVQRGWACLRLNLRGADRAGEDYYHAGLSADLHATLACSALAAFERILLLGFSLGGHVALRCAVESEEPRLGGTVAVCSPLALAVGVAAIDRRAGWVYRRYLLPRLIAIYAAVASRRPVPTPVDRLRRARRLRDYDELAVAPRHGFAGADDYYARASVGPLLGTLARPALLVTALDDPMVPADSIRPHLDEASSSLRHVWLRRGGHMGFPRSLDLGLGPRPGLVPQVCQWLAESSG